MLFSVMFAVLAVLVLIPVAAAQCPAYVNYSLVGHPPYTNGRYKLPFMRPSSDCRTFHSPAVESTIARMKSVIKDPDLYRLFQNSFPNTLDTTIKWRGYSADNPSEELAFVITGDINAMWYRDSANQLQSYLPLLKASSNKNSLASLYRGVINLQSRYLIKYPYCQSFQAPPESGIATVNNSGSDIVYPPYDPLVIWECKYELDSLAAFLEVSTNYANTTGDYDFFRKYNWVQAVQAVMDVAKNMSISTYAPNGMVLNSSYTFQRDSIFVDTLLNNGVGSPVSIGTGLIRSAFRPSDDPCIFNLFIPANMMFSVQLSRGAQIASRIGQSALANTMSDMSTSIRNAIQKYGITQDPDYGPVYSFEVDGYGSRNAMDDANIPSLLSMPVFGFVDASDATYQNTRDKVLSMDDPYYAMGTVINAVGGPHDGPGRAWPMARIVSILTSNNTAEIYTALKEIVSSTDGLGLIHESIDSFNQSTWTRQWFSWANGLFGQMILDLETRQPAVLSMSFQ